MDCRCNNVVPQTRMNKFPAIAFFGLAMILQTSVAAAPLRQPVGKWVVDYGDTACNAARSYGDPKSPITIAFRPSPNGTVVRLIVLRPGGAPQPHHLPVRTSIVPENVKMTALRFASNDRKTDIFWINFDQTAIAKLGSAGEIAIKGKWIDERFALPDMVAVLKALDRCNADLRNVWNVSPSEPARIAKGAVATAPLHSYFSADDYPSQAQREEASGAARIMMMVDQTGKLKDCMVEQASGIATLDAATCGILLQRAKFSPAQDANGKPVRSVLTTTIRWTLTD